MLTKSFQAEVKFKIAEIKTVNFFVKFNVQSAQVPSTDLSLPPLVVLNKMNVQPGDKHEPVVSHGCTFPQCLK
jgi:hypothetical protein